MRALRPAALPELAHRPAAPPVRALRPAALRELAHPPAAPPVRALRPAALPEPVLRPAALPARVLPPAALPARVRQPAALPVRTDPSAAALQQARCPAPVLPSAVLLPVLLLPERGLRPAASHPQTGQQWWYPVPGQAHRCLPHPNSRHSAICHRQTDRCLRCLALQSGQSAFHHS